MNPKNQYRLLKAVTYADKKITSLGEDMPVGNLDGVESDGAGGYYVTDWMAGNLFYFDAEGNAQINLKNVILKKIII